MPFTEKPNQRSTRYLKALLVTAMASMCAHLLFPLFHAANLIMIYLLGVVIVAVRYGRGPSVVASLLSVAAFDFFFVHPYFTFVVSDTQYLLSFSVMLAVALIISTLTTNIKEQSEAAASAKLEAETEHLRSTLLSSLSHDLRTPLATITGAAESLSTGGERMDQQTSNELKQVIYEESRRMNRLVNNLLDMTRLELGSVSVKKEWFPAEEVLGSALSRLEGELDDRTVSVCLSEELPLVPMDGILMEQAFVNLVENAVKYTEPGTPIEITARLLPGEVVFEVSDSGPGLRAGEEERIFEKFYRGEQTSARSGVGLGLTVCKGIVKAHGGRIWAQNGKEGGAVFSISLPLEGVPPQVVSEEMPSNATPAASFE